MKDECAFALGKQSEHPLYLLRQEAMKFAITLTRAALPSVGVAILTLCPPMSLDESFA
jgi:hypothetical protein